MLRRISKWLYCPVTLPNGIVLKGTPNPERPHLLLSGTAVLPDGRVFSGNFHKELGFPLQGSQLEEDGDLYRGGFNAHWQRDGPGEAWLADGTHYKGWFCADELVEGVVRIPDGTSEAVFEGTLKDESFVRGRLTQQNFTYEGEFQGNQPHGKGRLVFETGAEQEGTFFAGKLHGSNCKMKLDGGFVYVGEFMDGKTRSGTLYTPTYTYEGEFNENGQAHGEGRQTYLTNEPRLIFSGVWSNGALVRGACVDEYGTPVDWQDNYGLQEKILGSAAQCDGAEAVAMSSYCSAKLKEADQLHKSMNRSYMQDAEAVRERTGKYPSKMDLGYEGGIQRERDAVEKSSRRQFENMARLREELGEQNQKYEETSTQLKDTSAVVGEINENIIKMQFTRQLGAQRLAAERVDEQFERFLKDFDRQPTRTQSRPDGTLETIPQANLSIDGNEAWKSFTSSL